MIEVDKYSKAWEVLPIDRLYRADLRKGYKSHMAAAMGLKVFRISEDVKFCGNVVKKGTWCVQQDFIEGLNWKVPTCTVGEEWGNISKLLRICRVNLLKTKEKLND